MRRDIPERFAELQPHIGEYVTKTNAIRGDGQDKAAPREQGAACFRGSC